MFYEYYCEECHEHSTVNKPIEDRNRDEHCEICDYPLKRLFSLPIIHMNEMVAEGFRRTNEPPDDLKPDGYHKTMRDEIENIPHMTSYPNRATKRKKGMVH